MSKKHEPVAFISDSGIIESNNSKRTKIFCFICNILSVALGILGLIAFVKGNF